jgi:hypothetical protein
MAEEQQHGRNTKTGAPGERSGGFHRIVRTIVTGSERLSTFSVPASLAGMKRHDTFSLMPNLFRTLDGTIHKAGETIPLTLPNGAATEGVWAGSATEEKLQQLWLRSHGNQITQSEFVAAVASKAEDNGEMIWGDAPSSARLFFVLVAPERGKSYRLAKLVTIAATPAQVAHFRHKRASLFGYLESNGTIVKVAPLDPPPPPPPAQGELF